MRNRTWKTQKDLNKEAAWDALGLAAIIIFIVAAIYWRS